MVIPDDGEGWSGKVEFDGFNGVLQKNEIYTCYGLPDKLFPY